MSSALPLSFSRPPRALPPPLHSLSTGCCLLPPSVHSPPHPPPLALHQVPRHPPQRLHLLQRRAPPVPALRIIILAVLDGGGGGIINYCVIIDVGVPHRHLPCLQRRVGVGRAESGPAGRRRGRAGASQGAAVWRRGRRVFPRAHRSRAPHRLDRRPNEAGRPTWRLAPRPAACCLLLAAASGLRAAARCQLRPPHIDGRPALAKRGPDRRRHFRRRWASAALMRSCAGTIQERRRRWEWG